MLERRVPVGAIDPPLVSFVVPVLDEVEILDALHARIVAVMERQPERFELVLVDDGSRDGSWERMKTIEARDPRLVLVRLSRNFGHQIAISAGLDHAHGDAVIVLDADLQDPPEAVPHLLERWRAGSEIVHARRSIRRGEGLLRRMTAAAFYRVLRRIATYDIPEDTGDFRLMSRRVVEHLRALREKNRYVRGMVAWLGFRPAEILYDRAPRHAGESKFPLRSLARMAVDAVMSSSRAPLRVVTGCGLVLVTSSLVLGGWAGFASASERISVARWAALIAVLLFLGGAQLAAIGLVGEYVRRVLDEVRGRPLYLVDEVIGGERAQEAAPPRAVPR